MDKKKLILEELTSSNGAKIKVHFEDEALKESFQRNYLHEKFQKEIRECIDLEKIDTGGTIHLLINRYGVGQLMNESEYLKWQAKGKKDGFYLPIDPLEVFNTVLALAEIDLFERMRGYKFVGPTREEFNDLFSNPINIDKFRLLNCHYDCKLCPVLTEDCLERKASFDYEALKKFLQQNYVESKSGVLH